MSGATRQLAQGIAELSTAPAAVRSLGESWRRTHVMHGDLKFANVVVGRDAGSRARRLWLIDWELGGVGDPAWDLGSVVGQLLATWVGSMAIRREVDLADIVADADFDLAAADRWLTDWWQAYRSARTTPMADDLAARTCAFAGVRTIQTAFEIGQQSHRATGLMMTMAQAGANVVAAPGRAIASILPRFGHGARTT
jgi:aminoglycoside phosphotransferase (APT) family kinase protein